MKYEQIFNIFIGKLKIKAAIFHYLVKY